MATNEEYLDNLLKAFEEEEKAREKENHIVQEKTIITEDNADIQSLLDEVADLPGDDIDNAVAVDDIADLMQMFGEEILSTETLSAEMLGEESLSEESLSEESLSEESLSEESLSEELLSEESLSEQIVEEAQVKIETEEAETEEAETEETEEVPADDIAELMSMLGAESLSEETLSAETLSETEAKESFINEDSSEEIMSLLNTSEDDLLKMLQAEGSDEALGIMDTDSVGSDSENEWKGDLDELLAAAVDKLDENQDFFGDTITNESMSEDMDITQMIDGLDHVDDSLSEISELLKKSDNNENVGVFTEPDSAETDEINESGKGKKGKKGRKAPKEKKEPGALKQFWKALMEDDEEEKPEGDKNTSSDENDELLKQLDDSNKKEKKKEKKKKEKKKKEKKNKKGAQNPREEDDDLNGEDAGKGKKKKREKKKKEKSEAASMPREKSKKVLSRKFFMVLVAFCASLIAIIVCLCAFVPEYVEKNQAREAFYHGDYETAHVLLYGKNLNESDKLILDRVTVVLQLERKLEAYYLNEETGKKAIALDALMQGISYYQELPDKNVYGAGDELKESYQKILDILNQKYGVDEAKALEMLSCDDIRYSQWIYSVAEGMDFDIISEDAHIEEAEPAGPQDVLPEEEDIINTNIQN